MSKELKALKRIETTFSMNKQGKESVYREYTNSIYPYYEDFDLVLKALQRLEAIDNANPSEALKCVDVLKEDGCITTLYQGKALETIKQALLKAQEQEKSLKALEIIKEKRIDIESFYTSFIEGDYDYGFYERRYGTYGKYCLTKEEFNLLKEVLE